jgi:hypothetical protein
MIKCNGYFSPFSPLSFSPAVLFYAGGTAALEYYAGVRTPDWEVDII